MRRIGVVILALSLTLAPVVGAAQPAGKVWRIGVLTTGNPRSAPPANWDGFLQGLRESGYVEGQNVAFEQRYAEGKPELFPDRAADLVRLKVDVIFGVLFLGEQLSLLHLASITTTLIGTTILKLSR